MKLLAMLTQLTAIKNTKIMKKLSFLILLLACNLVIGQTIANIDTDAYFTAPLGTYLKDINHTFEPFLGTWKCQNGNEILIVKLEKVEMYYYSEFGTYDDFIKGNYSYSTDGGQTYIVNTIQQNIVNNNPFTNSMYSSMPRSNTVIYFKLKDIVYNKNVYAKFTFQNNNFNQIHLRLENKGGGYIFISPPNPAFCIPNNVILIKQ